MNGGLNFKNCVGGSGGSSNLGVNIASAVSAPAIIAIDCLGGPGTGNDWGFCGGSCAWVFFQNLISLTAGSLGTASSEYGIDVTSTIQVGDAGTMTLNGTGGGLYNGSGSQNFGIFLNGATLIAGNGGTAATPINITGMGGSGSGSLHFGVSIPDALTVHLNNTNSASSLNFVNCVGGTGSAGFTYGVNFAGSMALVNGALNFKNCVGGVGTTQNHGVLSRIRPLSWLLRSSRAIALADRERRALISGSTSTAEHSVLLTVTNVITLSAGSLGTSSNEVGIQVNTNTTAGQIIVGDGGTLNLNGSGGGSTTGLAIAITG